MRQNLVRADVGLINYSIREINTIANDIEVTTHIPMIWENIGDPVGVGEPVTPWIREIVEGNAGTSDVFAYTDSKGNVNTRRYVLENFSSKKVCTIDDILFFNGLGEAINKIFSSLPRTVRVLLPSPVYPAYASAESLHSGCHYLSYNLDPDRNWEPDLSEIEKKVHYNEQIVGIVVINPNNPTGISYSKETLIKIVEIANKYNCFLIFDEIYNNMLYEGHKHTFLYEIIGEVPGISMKGISKDIPWPGARCGWIEVYNTEKNKNFRSFIDTLNLIKMLEVCSTTLPQKVLPYIYGHKKYKEYLEGRILKYTKRANEAYAFFKKIQNVRIVKPTGVFYLVVELLNLPYSKLVSINKETRLYLDTITQNKMCQDFHFVYELMGAKSVCVVPLSSFGTPLTGFRMTLLQEDDSIFTDTLVRIRDAIDEYYDI